MAVEGRYTNTRIQYNTTMHTLLVSFNRRTATLAGVGVPACGPCLQSKSTDIYNLAGSAAIKDWTPLRPTCLQYGMLSRVQDKNPLDKIPPDNSPPDKSHPGQKPPRTRTKTPYRELLIVKFKTI